MDLTHLIELTKHIIALKACPPKKEKLKAVVIKTSFELNIFLQTAVNIVENVSCLDDHDALVQMRDNNQQMFDEVLKELYLDKTFLKVIYSHVVHVVNYEELTDKVNF